MERNICVAGIDPGLAGAVAIIRNNKLICAVIMPTQSGPKGGRDISAIALAEILKKHAPIDKLAIEVVHALRGQGVTSMFNFGKGYGKVLATVELLGIPILHVTPQRWKKSILDGLGRDKDAAVRYANSTFPTHDFKATPRCTKPHTGLTDATCIAEFARREVLGHV